MSLSQRLLELLDQGVRHIGEITIQTFDSIDRFKLSHHTDASKVLEPGHGGLEEHRGPDNAWNLATHADDGTYRFVKAQTNLRGGWVMILQTAEELRLALDHFYPASLGLWVASLDGNLEVENLRDKLNRQTGMYRFARNISTDRAQTLVQEMCGPAHQCARKILWQIDDATPLDDSDASRYNGIPGGVGQDRAIPLLCREACNHFVAACRQAAKEESAKTT